METLLNDFSPGLFAVSTILLLALIALMVKFAWKPILNSLEERESGIEDALAAAENARKEMQNLQSDNERLIKEARAERDEMMKDARNITDNMIAAAKEDAKEVTALASFINLSLSDCKFCISLRAFSAAAKASSIPDSLSSKEFKIGFQANFTIKAIKANNKMVDTANNPGEKSFNKVSIL